MAKVQFTPRKETNAIFVHCAATKPSQDIGVREIRQWHKEKGWLDIGYHFVIRSVISPVSLFTMVSISSASPLIAC